MKIFTNKSIWKKIVIALLIILSFQIITMQPVQADVVEFGGKLMGPIMSLLVSLGDGIMDMVGRTIMGTTTTLYEVEMGNTFWETLGTVLVAIAAAAIAIVLIVATMGAAAIVAAAITGTVATVTVGMGTVIAAGASAVMASVWFNDQVLPDDLYLPMYTYSAEEIFKGNILLFDVNYFGNTKEIYAKTKNGNDIKLSNYNTSAKAEEKISQGGGLQYYYYKKDGKEIKTSNQNSAALLKKTISSWYNALRNICLVLMLSILVYIGIRMILSSVASDKAKYLTMLKDWFIGLCLLFLMHYIMAFSVMLVEKLTDVVKTSVDENAYTVVMEANQDMKDAVEELGLKKEDYIQEEGGTEYLAWPTNLMGSLRLQLQMEQYGAQYIGLGICFLILCLFTFYFTVAYLKRVLHMAFLTIIAPLVALTYCIDTINDGKAQGFDKWMKEYIFNLLIQPMHLLLYYILVTSAFELASTNTIYSIVALGFMIPAEKLLRSLFGFEKAQTAPAMGPAGAMMASTVLNSMLNRGKRGKDGGNGKGGESGEGDPGKVPSPREANPMDAFLGEGGGQSREEGNTPPVDTAMDRYTAEGYGQNADGEYFNPWTDEYDANYNPHNDPSYAPPEEEQANPTLSSSEDEGGEMGGQYDREVYDAYGMEPPPRQLPTQSPSIRTQKESKTPKTKEGRRVKRMLHASVAAQKAAMRNIPRNLKRKIEKSHPMKAMGKVAAGATLGAAAGAAGVAIAATTGDLGNLSKIGGGLAAAGYTVGSGKVGAIKSPMDDPDVKAVHDVAYTKGEYKQDAMDDYVKDYLKDVQNRNYFEQKFGAAEAKKILKKGGMVEKCLENEITDKKEIAAAYKLQKEGIVRNEEEAISVAQLGQMVGSNTNHMTSKKRNEWKTRFGDMAGESGVKDKDKFAEQRLKEIDKFNDFKK